VADAKMMDLLNNWERACTDCDLEHDNVIIPCITVCISIHGLTVVNFL
jgi:hypothetical protein